MEKIHNDPYIKFLKEDLQKTIERLECNYIITPDNVVTVYKDDSAQNKIDSILKLISFRQEEILKNENFIINRVGDENNRS